MHGSKGITTASVLQSFSTCICDVQHHCVPLPSPREILIGSLPFEVSEPIDAPLFNHLSDSKRAEIDKFREDYRVTARIREGQRELVIYDCSWLCKNPGELLSSNLSYFIQKHTVLKRAVTWVHMTLSISEVHWWIWGKYRLGYASGAKGEVADLFKRQLSTVAWIQIIEPLGDCVLPK